MTVLCVDPSRVEEFWPHVGPFIEMAFTRCGDDDAESVRADLTARCSLLWIVWDEAKIVAAATTKLIGTHRGKVCLITACSGHDGDEWIDEGIRQLADYARGEGCVALRICGRRGWRRRFPEWDEPFVTLERQL